MQHWKPSLFKLAFNLFGFSRPFMKNKKIFICAVKETDPRLTGNIP